MDVLAQAALQNQLLDFSTIMKLYTTTSVAEKQRMVEANEKRVREQQQQQQEQQMQLQQQQLQQQAQIAQANQQMQYQMHKEDNETKILVAKINSVAEEQRFAMMQHEDGLTKEQQLDLEERKLDESSKQFDAKMNLEKEKLKENTRLKEKQINKSNAKSK
jgi:Ca-activated chloride channel family protein